jgi:hypothetical protein
MSNPPLRCLSDPLHGIMPNGFGQRTCPFSPSPELLLWTENRVGGLLKELKTRETEIHWRDAKIEKLTLELLYLRRMKFGVKSESLALPERDLFEESLTADLAACEAPPGAGASGGRHGATSAARREAQTRTRRPSAPAGAVAACRAPARARQLHLWPMWSGAGANRRGRDRKAQHRPCRVLRRASPLPEIRLPSLRDDHRRAGCGFGHRRWSGNAGVAGLGHGQQVRGSSAALSPGTPGRPLGSDPVPLHPGRLGGPYRRRPGTALAAPHRAAAPVHGAACR